MTHGQLACRPSPSARRGAHHRRRALLHRADRQHAQRCPRQAGIYPQRSELSQGSALAQLRRCLERRQRHHPADLQRHHRARRRALGSAHLDDGGLRPHRARRSVRQGLLPGAADDPHPALRDRDRPALPAGQQPRTPRQQAGTDPAAHRLEHALRGLLDAPTSSTPPPTSAKPRPSTVLGPGRRSGTFTSRWHDPPSRPWVC